MKLEGQLGILDSQSTEYLSKFKDRLNSEKNITSEISSTSRKIDYILNCRTSGEEVRQCEGACGGACGKQCKNLL